MKNWVKTNVEIKVAGDGIATEASRIFHDVKADVTDAQLDQLGQVVEDLSNDTYVAAVVVNYQRHEAGTAA